MPGTATLSSGYTDTLTRIAIRCDQQRILARLQNGAGGCSSCAPTVSGGGVNASVLELNAQRGCQNQLSVQSSGQSSGQLSVQSSGQLPTSNKLSYLL